MKKKKMGLEELLRCALDMEVAAAQLFFIATGKTRKQEVKKVLMLLTKDEEQHFFTILKMFNRVTEGNKSLTYTNEDRERSVAHIAEKIRKAHIDTTSEVEDIIQFAIQEEQDVQEFYRQCIRENEYPSIKRLLEKLLKEEVDHEDYLKKLIDNKP